MVPDCHDDVLRFVATMRDEIDTIRHGLDGQHAGRFELLDENLNRLESWIVRGYELMVVRIDTIVAEIEVLRRL